jgi:hypothetical protein
MEAIWILLIFPGFREQESKVITDITDEDVENGGTSSS